MALFVTVADRLDHLADSAAAVLRSPLDDPFITELVAVPSDGVRTWLIQQLAVRLGDGGPGITANIDFVFPSSLVRRILTDSPTDGQIASPDAVDPHGVGRLTWAIHHLLGPGGPLVGDLGLEVDLMRARSIADLFDRYAVHRSTMMRNWERSLDLDALGRPLPAHHRWQPALWRAVVDLLQVPSPVAEIDRALERLRAADLRPSVPPRLLVVGQSSFAERQLATILAASAQIDVHLMVPVWSEVVAGRVTDLATRHELFTPLERVADPSVGLCHQPLARSWAVAPRESGLLLSGALVAAGVVDRVRRIDDLDDEGGLVEPATLLEALHADLRADRPGRSPEERFVIAPDDRSITWYRCPGIARQAEVVRDVVRHLLSEVDTAGRPLFEPRHIAVLSPDPARIAPFIEAAFADDGDLGPIPVRVADRSLGHDSPLMEVVASVLALCEGRFRRSEVLELAALEPVAVRFGFDVESRGRISDWATSTNVAWGMDAEARRTFGVPEEITTHTWAAGVEQLLVGAALADPTLAPRDLSTTFGPGDTVASGAVEGDDVELLGRWVEFLALIGGGVERLMSSTSPERWASDLAELVAAITTVDDPWHRRRFERLLEDLVASADGLAGRAVDGGELARFVLGSLGQTPGRVRFGTGAVTVSSLTAQRGVPHRVVILAGLDGDLGSSAPRADDLMAMIPCVGDRDPRHEIRSQLLDAVLAAGERLVITSDGVDVVTSADIPPVVPLAEFADVLDQLAIAADGRAASERITVDQPRHRWSTANFVAGALGLPGPWSHDRRALEAARRGADRAPWSVRSTPIDDISRHSAITVDELRVALLNPVEAFARFRLGATMPRDDEIHDDQIPLSLGGLARHDLRRQLLDRRLAAGATWSATDLERWSSVAQRSGSVPPLHFGTSAIAVAVDEYESVFAAFAALCPDLVDDPGEEITLAVPISGAGSGAGHRVLDCRIERLHGSTIVDLRASKIDDQRRLAAWIQLLAIASIDPTTDARAVVVGFDRKKAVAESLSLADPGRAAADLGYLVEMYDIARRHPIPALASTSRAIHDGGDRWAGQSAWITERTDRWVRLVLGALEYAEILEIDVVLDADADGPRVAVVEWWAERLWTLFENSLVIIDHSRSAAEDTR